NSSHGGLTSKMRNIDALDTPGERRQPKFRLKRGESLIHIFRRSSLLAKGVLRVLSRELEQLPLRSPLGHDKRRLFYSPLCGAGPSLVEPLHNARGRLRQHRDNDFVGNKGRTEAAVSVVFPKECRHDLVIAHLSPHVTHIADFDHAALANIDDAELDDVPFSMNAEDVLIDVADGHDALSLTHFRDSFELVAINGRDLKLHVLGGCAHPLF